MSNSKLKETTEIKRFNQELINALSDIDCSWFQGKEVSYDCCNALAFLFTQGKLKDIVNCEDLRITVPGYKVSFSEMCEKDRDTDEKEWERICENIQVFAFFNSECKHFDDLLYLAKLLGILIYINCPAHIEKFAETCLQPGCLHLIKDLIASEQIQFTAKNVEYSCENYFTEFNNILLDSVMESIHIGSIAKGKNSKLSTKPAYKLCATMPDGDLVKNSKEEANIIEIIDTNTEAVKEYITTWVTEARDYLNSTSNLSKDGKVSCLLQLTDIENCICMSMIYRVDETTIADICIKIMSSLVSTENCKEMNIF